ncbi:MAG: hypothetical protein JNM19_05695 [Chitinophagaceae bacterium]|nr:hypothetical protein [Chitinophagaceae bacterium]
MQFDYQHLLNPHFHPGSRVWVYQSNRLFTLSEAFEIEDLLKEFTTTWKSHGTPVKGEAHLFFGQFVILLADETATGVSGCSTDSSVRLVKNIEERFGVNMFDRMALAFIIKEKIQLLPLSQLQYAAANGFITPDTLYFNNLVQTKEELETNWIIPVKESWLSKKINFTPITSHDNG